MGFKARREEGQLRVEECRGKDEEVEGTYEVRVGATERTQERHGVRRSELMRTNQSSTLLAPLLLTRSLSNAAYTRTTDRAPAENPYQTRIRLIQLFSTTLSCSSSLRFPFSHRFLPSLSAHVYLDALLPLRPLLLRPPHPLRPHRRQFRPSPPSPPPSRRLPPRHWLRSSKHHRLLRALRRSRCGRRTPLRWSIRPRPR